MTAVIITQTFEHGDRPWTHNAERRMHPMARAAIVSEWRTAFGWIARAQHARPLAHATVEVQPWQATRRSLADTGACAGAAKAAIDGLVDAGLLPDDDPAHLHAITYRAPLIGRDALVITITGPEAS